MAKTVKERARKPKSVNAAQGLIDALKFVNAAQKKNDHIFQKYVVLQDKTLIATDGTLAIGTRIEEEINACPRSDMLLAALSKVGERFSLTVEDEQLCIVSGDFTAHIPCIPLEQIPVTFTSPNMMPLDDSLKAAFSAVMDIAKEGAPHIMTASLMLRDNTVVAANNEMIKEYWHGFRFPMVFIIPKLAVQCVAKTNKTLVGVGGSTESLTFWFSDQSFIQTTLMPNEWNDVDTMLNQPTNALPLPSNFWQAINSIVDFGESNLVLFHDDCVTTESGKARFEIEGLQGGQKFDGKLLKSASAYIKRIDCRTHKNRLYFFGEKLRGLLGGH
ncbi:DNA polymerase processivity factor [Acinetobacter phage IMEAB3]|uniref:Putative DNA polymerase subunit n=2 Tax=Lokivirus IMEAB3 TaxID=2560266 RepID=A0A481S209_9CAUD|nr:DNA polymerase processivity factor [Acinetobacter phage IMEAB3]AHI60018.1 putative DNA polymerase subunit [Acinetobacter phage IMEAB3]QBG78733.1 putative DNA polymerase subunit [Acinetobacter phage vB_AbaS_D0]HCH8772067.1 hypothetical protein [Salmonella enterica]